MPKLDALEKALRDRGKPTLEQQLAIRDLERVAEFNAVMRDLAAEQKRARDDYAAVVRHVQGNSKRLESKIDGIPQPDLKPLHKAIGALPKTIPTTDLGPVIAELKSLASTLEARIKAIPAPRDVDLSQIVQRLDALAQKVDAIDVSMPDISIAAQKPQPIVEPKKRVFKHKFKYNLNGDPIEGISEEV